MSNKKERIFKSALKLFTTYGFHGTPTSRIAKEAGVATGTLFHYFATKQDLIDELYLECKSALIKAVVETTQDEDDIETWLRGAFANSVRWATRNREKYLFFEQFYNSPNISSITREEGINRASVLFDLIEKARNKGILKNIEFQLLLDLSYGISNAVTKHILDRNITDEEEVSQIIEESYPIFLDAIKA